MCVFAPLSIEDVALCPISAKMSRMRDMTRISIAFFEARTSQDLLPLWVDGWFSFAFNRDMPAYHKNCPTEVSKKKEKGIEKKKDTNNRKFKTFFFFPPYFHCQMYQVLTVRNETRERGIVFRIRKANFSL